MSDHFRIYDARTERANGSRYGGRSSERSELESLRDQLREQADTLDKLREEAAPIGTVVEIRGDRMGVSFGPGNALDVNAIAKARVGDRVLCHRNSMQPFEVVRDDVPTGTIVVAQRQVGDLVEAEIMTTLRAFRTPPGMTIQKGERIIVDASQTFVLGTLGMPPQVYSHTQKIAVSWDDVGGHAEAKAALREAIELPFSHTKLFASYGKRCVRGVLLSGPSGCIAGDIHVPYSVHAKDGERRDHKGGSLERLYHRFNGLPRSGKGNWQHPESIGARYFVPSMNEDGKIYRNEISAVIDSGMKPCLRIRTTSGLELVCTADHPIATNEGFSPADSLKIGSKILTHQNVKWTNGDEERRHAYRPEVLVKHHPNARTKIVRTSSGEYEYKRLRRYRAAFEANLNGMDLACYIQRLNDGALDGLMFSNPNDDIHHLDENYFNDSPDNLIAISHADHAVGHMDNDRSMKLRAHVAIEDEIESIDDAGERRTYDIKMKIAPHNFVAAGFVVHNCGKTILAKAAATAIARAHGAAHADGFVYVKGPELINKFIGATEEAIRRLFTAAREHYKQHGYPCVIFLDECDALLGARDLNSHISINATTVPQFLAEMDGLDDQATMLILATNRPDMLDPAVTREGRVDRRVRVGRPSQADACEIFKIHLRDRPIAKEGHNDGELASLCTELLYDGARIVRELGSAYGVLRLCDFASGAMIAGIVEQASTAAMLRDIGTSAKKPSGISLEDLRWATDQAQTALGNINHAEAIKEAIEQQPKGTTQP